MILVAAPANDSEGVMCCNGAECTCYTSGSVTFLTDLPLLFETKAANCSPISVNRTQGLTMICLFPFFSLVLYGGVVLHTGVTWNVQLYTDACIPHGERIDV